MLVDQREPARRLAAEERAHRLDVLPLAPRRAGDGLARPGGGPPRARCIADDGRVERRAGVGDRQVIVRLERGAEGLLGAGAERQEPVHALLEALGGEGRGRRDRQTVAIGYAHGEVSIG